MKKFLFIFTAALAITALAQVSPIRYTVGKVPSTLAAGAVTNLNHQVDMRAHALCNFTFQCRGTDASTDPVVLRFAVSDDGSIWGDYQTIELPLNDTSLVSTTVQFNVGALGYLRLTSVSNSSTVTITNLLGRVFVCDK